MDVIDQEIDCEIELEFGLFSDERKQVHELLSHSLVEIEHQLVRDGLGLGFVEVFG